MAAFSSVILGEGEKIGDYLERINRGYEEKHKSYEDNFWLA
jgi:hypothetical protein